MSEMTFSADNISSVVSAGLCVGCGACVSFCPADAVSMRETPAGLFVASVDQEKCTRCGICLEICPGWRVKTDWFPPPSIDPFEGEILEAYVGYSADEELRASAQSGGVVTALLEHLLTTEVVKQAAVTRMPADGSLRPTTVLSASKDEIRAAVGSKYCPVAACRVAREAIESGPTAFVGVPCQVHALRNIDQWRRGRGLGGNGDSIIIGLACEGVLSYLAMDHLVSLVPVERDDVVDLLFRSKERRGWPGDVCVTGKDGRKFWLPRQKRMACKSTYRPTRCLLCWDKCNALADVVAMDPWGISGDEAGLTVVIARTERGLRCLQSAQQAGSVVLEPVSAGRVIEGMRLEHRRRDWSAYTAIWRQLGRVPPQFGIGQRWVAPTSKVRLAEYADHLAWTLELAGCLSTTGAQRRAKRRIRREKIRKKLARVPGFGRFWSVYWRTLGDAVARRRLRKAAEFGFPE